MGHPTVSDRRGRPIDRPVNIHDIARAAAVSKTTVSRVLNGSADVAPTTRSRVLEAVAQLGSQVDSAARPPPANRRALGCLVAPPLHRGFGQIAQHVDYEVSSPTD